LEGWDLPLFNQGFGKKFHKSGIDVFFKRVEVRSFAVPEEIDKTGKNGFTLQAFKMFKAQCAEYLAGNGGVIKADLEESLFGYQEGLFLSGFPGGFFFF